METMKQMTLSAGGFERYGKTTRRAAFLAEMDRVVPWGALCALIEPVYPKAGNGRPPIGLEQMLRIHDLRHSFASLLVSGGRSLYEVQQILGHSDPKVTMRYAHLSAKALQAAANTASVIVPRVTPNAAPESPRLR
jgi:hypothetical protein